MLDYEGTFESAFSDNHNTSFNLPAADVNEIMRTSYDVEEGFIYTAHQLWDMETRKAHQPDKYLRHLVRPGSLKTFGNTHEGSMETFTRISDQRLWKDMSKFTTVIEHVCLDHAARRAFFIGAERTETPDGDTIIAGRDQPLFHVEHSVTGSEERPLNIWRVVHLTDEKDKGLLNVFEELARSPYLREFNEIYIGEDLGQSLARK